MSDAEDMIFEDAENFRQQNNTIREQYMRQLSSCIAEGSKEMTRGGVLRRVVNGQVVEVMRPDQIAVFQNHVEMLRTLLVDEIDKHPKIINEYISRFDKHIEGINDSIKKALEQLEQNVKPPKTYDPNLISYSLTQQYNDGCTKIRELADQQKYEAYKTLLEGLKYLLSVINYGEAKRWSQIDHD